jgi:Peptidase M30
MNLLDRQARDICGLTGNRTFDRGKEDRDRENILSSTPAIVGTLLKKYAGAGEETSAMMIEDWVSFNIDPTFNAVRDIRFNQYLAYEGHGSCT